MNQPLDVSGTVKSKSVQLNVDDMLGQEKYIVVEGVNVVNDPQQPIHIYYEAGRCSLLCHLAMVRNSFLIC